MQLAVRDRYVAVNGDHPMTAEDDAYVREHFVAATPEAMALMLDDRLPLPSYVLGDGTPMVPATHGGSPRSPAASTQLHDWFVAFWGDDPATGEQEWGHYLSGQYVCLREVIAGADQAEDRAGRRGRRRGRPAAPRPPRPDRARDARRGGRRRARACPGWTRCCCR